MEVMGHVLGKLSECKDTRGRPEFKKGTYVHI